MPSTTQAWLPNGVRTTRDDPAGLPPLFIEASAAEMLLDGSLLLAERAARVGVETTLAIWPHMFHAWQGMAGLLPEADETVRRAANFMNTVATGRTIDGSALRHGPAPVSTPPA